MTIKTTEVWERGQLKDIVHGVAINDATTTIAYRVAGPRVLVRLMDDDCNEAEAFMSVDWARSLRDQLTAAIQEATK